MADHDTKRKLKVVVMEGLIVKSPYAELIIDGKKEWELRGRCPPSSKLNKELYLLSSGKALGKVKINAHWAATKRDLEQNMEKHQSETLFLSEHHISHVWQIKVVEKFAHPKKYVHPMGARVWVLNVLFVKQQSISDFA